MSNEVSAPKENLPVDQASIEDAFLAIPDEENPPIIDARKTFWVTVIMAILFIGSVFVFIL